jgi:hypothetical protein
MSEIERRFHEEWLGMVQPTDGLVVSIPVLVDKQCMMRHGPELQQRLREQCPSRPTAYSKDEQWVEAIADLGAWFAAVLELEPQAFDGGSGGGTSLADDLSLWVPEGKQTLRPTLALRHADPPAPLADDDPEATPGARAGRPYVALVWDLAAEEPQGIGLPLDAAETITGAWHYAPSAKFERLLRHCRVPIGILTNRTHVRLVYAPHGESVGAITFRVSEMVQVGGRPILDALVMLLGRTRWFGVAAEQSLPAILAESRKRQAEVTNALADQVFEALEILLRGFEAAADRDVSGALGRALRESASDVYAGLLTVQLRLVFLLYAEDRGLLPVEHPTYAAHYSVLGLFERLQADAGSHPDAMSRRFGAWSQLLAMWRGIFVGMQHDTLVMPARRGKIFDPNAYPFLEGRTDGGSSPIHFGNYEARAATRVPLVDDETVYRVLERLLVLDRQRLSYRALDVEQIGSVYEKLMGYDVVELSAAAVALRPAKAGKVWVSGQALVAVSKRQRAKWLQEDMGLVKAQAEKIAKATEASKTEAGATDVLAGFRIKGTDVASAGRLVIQPGSERRKSRAFYTPRSLTEPIVRTALAPLLAVMGPAPKSGALLDLKICDPAMGSGAFLVEVVRQLGDQVVAAWTRENLVEKIADAHHDAVVHARRLVAQRCVYGVDKNPLAVQLAKLSLWLVTLAKDLPFTFVDHALCWGDSLVGLTFEQITGFHWKVPTGGWQQVGLFDAELRGALDEAVALRRGICDLAERGDAAAVRERERLLDDAEDAVERVRVVADLVVGAFFAHDKDKARESERKNRLDLVTAWLARGGGVLPEDLAVMRAKLRERVPAFHWMIELPEVFFLGREDPLAGGEVNRAAYFDAFVGNPPFSGKNGISETGGPGYLEWLQEVHKHAHGNADLSAHFFRRADALLGAHGTIGLIATNTIGQGDTRSTGLQPLLVERGYVIYDVTRNLPWPEPGAAVTVSIVHLARGTAAEQRGEVRLHDPDPDDAALVVTRRAGAINSRLRPTPERADPKALKENGGLSFQGSVVLGMGFVLTHEERATLVTKNSRNAERIFPYIGGEEVNTNPDQGFDRWVINFGQMELSEAERWPDLLAIVRERVKPERDANPRETRRKYWWRFGEAAPAMYDAIRGLSRCLVTARVTKHLCFSFQPTDRVLHEKLIVIPLDSMTVFGVLQSRVHAAWTWLLSSTLETRLNYAPSDCFESYPFPERDPARRVLRIEAASEALYRARADRMKSTSRGLTVTYNELGDSENHSPGIEALRRLHVDLDRAVLDAYGWNDIPVPVYATPRNRTEREQLEAFENEVIDRLFELNARRSVETQVERRDRAQPDGDA